ncbi:MAG: patatin-like phospholipase family protein [Pseudomonadota bacterium]
MSKHVTPRYSFALSLCWAVASLLLAAPVAAAVDEAASRPKIGLALSGGGARGAAHIGVLKVLEEHRVPIDYIAGTSMGSIVGGLYASGSSPDDIAAAVRSIDWEAVFTDSTPRQDRTFRRKRDDDLYLVKARPGIGRKGLKFPAGLIQGQKIDLALARLTRPVAHIDDFDAFRIPFRAVATDIVTGEEIVLGSGKLTEAVRASMSVPAAFAPTVIDGRKLVDGGVANNLPIDIVRRMGADIVIAVDISTPLLNDAQVNSVLSVTVQLTGFLTRRNTEAQIASLTDDDLLLVPELGDLTSADFPRALEAVPAGVAAAEQARARLEALSLTPAAYARYRDSLVQSTRTDDAIDFIRLDNRSSLRDGIIAARIRDTRVGDRIDTRAIERDVGRIDGHEHFQNVTYDVVEEDGQTGIEITAEERAWGPVYAQVGATYDSNTDGDNLFNLGFAVLATGINAANGELRGGLQLGDEPAGFVNVHQPWGDKGMWFADASVLYQNQLITIFNGDDPEATYGIQETVLEAALGREFGTWGEARLGLRYGDGDARVRVGSRVINPELAYQRGEFFASLFADELDSFFFPTEGYLASVEYIASRDGLGADSDFDQVVLGGVYTQSFGRHSLSALFDFGTTISGTAPVQSLFRAGGLFNLSGFNRNELEGQHYARLGLSYYKRLESFEQLPVYVGALVERGNVFDSRSDIGWNRSLNAGAVYVGVDSFLGPLSMAWGLAEGGNDGFYVFLGRPF